jgi:hypothetical protein
MSNSKHGFVTKETEDTIYTPKWVKVYERIKDSLIKFTDKLKEYHLEKGLDEDIDGKKRSQEDLRKIYKLILEVRYLENKGKANEEGEFEKNVSNHVKGLVGLGAAGEGELDKKLKIDYKEIGEFYLVE